MIWQHLKPVDRILLGLVVLILGLFAVNGVVWPFLLVLLLAAVAVAAGKWMAPREPGAASPHVARVVGGIGTLVVIGALWFFVGGGAERLCARSIIAGNDDPVSSFACKVALGR